MGKTGKSIPVRKRVLPMGVVLLLAAWMWPSPGPCKVIRTEVTVQGRPHLRGGWDLAARIANTGNAEMVALQAFVFVDGWTEVFPGLGNLRPGDTLEMETRCVPESARAGRYTGMVRLHFEEKAGRRHKFFHPFELIRGEPPLPEDVLAVTLEEPSFHPRAFWRPAPELVVSIQNPGAERLEAHVQAFFPRGITTPSPYVVREVGPGQAVKLVFPLNAVEPQPDGTRFHVAVWYENAQGHLSRHLEGRLSVEDGPVLIRAYLVAALGVLGVVFAAGLLRRKPRETA